MAKQTFNNPTTGTELQDMLNAMFTELYDITINDRAISHTYIPEGNEVGIALTANVVAKYQLPVTARKIKNFGIQEIGGQPGVYALHYTGTRSITCKIDATSSIIGTGQNTIITLMMYKNGNMAAGAIISRKIATGGDLGAMALSGTFDAEPGDYLEVYVKSDLNTTLTFKYTNIVITEL